LDYECIWATRVYGGGIAGYCATRLPVGVWDVVVGALATSHTTVLSIVSAANHFSFGRLFPLRSTESHGSQESVHSRQGNWVEVHP